jgi:hypothetical protein
MASPLAIASIATSSLEARLRSEQLKRRRRRLDSHGRTHRPGFGDRDVAGVAMRIQPNAAHHLSVVENGLQRRAITTTTDPCSQHTRTLAGAANHKWRALSP